MEVPTLRKLSKYERRFLEMDWQNDFSFDLKERRLLYDYVGETNLSNFISSIPEIEGPWFHYLRTGKTYQQEEREAREARHIRRLDQILAVLIILIILCGLIRVILVIKSSGNLQ